MTAFCARHAAGVGVRRQPQLQPEHGPRQRRLPGATSAEQAHDVHLEAAPHFGFSADRGVAILVEISDALTGWQAVAFRNGIPECEGRLFASAPEIDLRSYALR
jgi:hypothetical protein